MMAEDASAMAAQFGCSLKELRELMEYRGHEGYEKIQNDYGGAHELCKRLKTSPNEGKPRILFVVVIFCHFDISSLG